MFRLLTLAATLGTTATAAAQGFSRPLVTPGPVPVIGPSGRVTGYVQPSLNPAVPTAVVVRPTPPTPLPYRPGIVGGFYPYGYPIAYPVYVPSYYGPAGTVTGGLVGANVGPSPVQDPPVPVPLEGAGGGSPPVPAASGTQAGSLVISLPAAGELWADGVKQPGRGRTFTLATPPLAAGRSHRFTVRAEWAIDGRRYAMDRSVSVAAGDRQRLTVVAGDPVK